MAPLDFASHLESTFAPQPAATPGLTRLAPKAWFDKIKAAAQLRRDKQAADKQARELDKRWRNARAELIAAIGTNAGAACGSATVTLKPGAESVPTITLHTGVVVPWSVVASVKLADGRTLPAKDVATLYGGRAASVDLQILGV